MGYLALDNGGALVISLFDRSGVMVKPWSDAGFDTLTVDIEPARHSGKSIIADIKAFKVPECSLLFAFPPCTHLAGSGARWWHDKGLEPLIDGLSLVSCAVRASKGADFYLIENPVGRLSTIWCKPNWMFNPYEYAMLADTPDDEAYTKRTCIWGNITKPPTCAIPPVLGSKMHKLPPSPDRAYLRSVTPSGFANAMFLHMVDYIE